MVGDWDFMMFYNMGFMVCMGLLVNIMFSNVGMVFDYSMLFNVLFNVRVLLDNNIVLVDMNGFNMPILNHSIGSVFIVVMLSDRC